MNVAVLSGGVGGARFLRGLVSVVETGNVSIIGNVADDLEVLGLHVSPDLDSILYALAGLADEERGWGRSDESWRALETVAALGGEAWFSLGDRDLGLHLVRTQLLREGVPLSEVTARLASALDLRAKLLPATDAPVRTFVETPAGNLPVSDVVRRTRPSRRGRRRSLRGGARGNSRPGRRRGARGRRSDRDRPEQSRTSRSGRSSPSPRSARRLRRGSVPAVAVSPLVGGRAVKGPADRMLQRLAGGTSPAHVAGCYPGLIDALVVDASDEAVELPGGVRRVVTNTLMTDLEASRRLAAAVLDAAGAHA